MRAKPRADGLHGEVDEAGAKHRRRVKTRVGRTRRRLHQMDFEVMAEAEAAQMAKKRREETAYAEERSVAARDGAATRLGTYEYLAEASSLLRVVSYGPEIGVEQLRLLRNASWYGDAWFPHSACALSGVARAHPGYLRDLTNRRLGYAIELDGNALLTERLRFALLRELDASRVVVRDVRAEAHVRAVAVGELGFVEDELARRSAVDEKANRSRGTREVHDHGDVAPFVQRHAGFGDVFVNARLAGVETDRALRDIGSATTLGVVGGDAQLGTQRAHRPTVVTEARDVLQLIQSRRFYPRLKRQRARRFRDERAVEMA